MHDSHGWVLGRSVQSRGAKANVRGEDRTAEVIDEATRQRGTERSRRGEKVELMKVGDEKERGWEMVGFQGVRRRSREARSGAIRA